MGKTNEESARLAYAVAIVMSGGLMAACSGFRANPRRLFHERRCAGVAATGPGPAIAVGAPAVAGSLPATRCRARRGRSRATGQSIGSLAGEYHVSKQAIIAANHLEAPYKIKIGTRVTIPGAAAAPVQQRWCRHPAR